jgi:cyanate permease
MSAHRAIAIAGYVLTVIGLVGIILWRELLVVWAFMIFFGIATLPRALLDWFHERRSRA